MRDLKIDSLKGFAIVAVIIGHLCVLTSGITTANENLWLNIDLVIETVLPVYYFHIPLFFAMSILFVKEFSIKFLKKRFVQILVP
ncbi:acyltransferase family protein, partial [Patescibacteria group bacterium]|nr:acyltransferase family protein [Patescibacteria group bacterium]